MQLDKLEQFASWGIARFRRFTIWDVGVFKCCLLSLGLLLGTYFSKPLQRIRPLLWAVTVASYAYVIWRMVTNDDA